MPNRYVILKEDEGYRYYDAKKKKFSKLYDNLRSSNTTWFSPISAHQPYLAYKKGDKNEPVNKAGFIAKRVALLPLELPIAAIHDATCLVLGIGTFGIAFTTFSGTWLLGECE